MPEPKMTESVDLEPVHVTMIGTGPASGQYLPSGTVATTPQPGQPNIVLNVVNPLVAVLVRFTNTFLVTLFGLITASAATNAIPASDFGHLVLKCAGLLIAGAGIGLIKDLITVFGQLEKRFPLLTGNV